VLLLWCRVALLLPMRLCSEQLQLHLQSPLLLQPPLRHLSHFSGYSVLLLSRPHRLKVWQDLHALSIAYHSVASPETARHNKTSNCKNRLARGTNEGSRCCVAVASSCLVHFQEQQLDRSRACCAYCSYTFAARFYLSIVSRHLCHCRYNKALNHRLVIVLSSSCHRLVIVLPSSSLDCPWRFETFAVRTLFKIWSANPH
jgi:hypothetical protein